MGNYLKTKIMFELKASDIINYNILDYLKLHFDIAEHTDLYDTEYYKVRVYDYALKHNISENSLMPLLCIMKWHIYSWIEQLECSDLSNSNKYILIQSEQDAKYEWGWFNSYEEMLDLFGINLYMNNLLIHAEDEDDTEYSTKLYFKNSLTNNYNIISNTMTKYLIEQNIDTNLFSISDNVTKTKSTAIIPAKRKE